MNYPLIEPILIEIGPLAVRWYGLMYLLAFLTCYVLGNQRAKKDDSGWDKTDVSDAVFYGVVGTIVGGRLGFVLFYSFDRFLIEPLWLFRLWEGGMSFHG
ncbi:MAG: prolipoprotein diacylglyceryl transferase family protein, partial [Pseudomonadota bacterium]|nr:prolipoprotein diacylglyceryl transferase family protein [Pseudomonadota bacterium]